MRLLTLVSLSTIGTPEINEFLDFLNIRNTSGLHSEHIYLKSHRINKISPAIIPSSFPGHIHVTASGLKSGMSELPDIEQRGGA